MIFCISGKVQFTSRVQVVAHYIHIFHTDIVRIIFEFKTFGAKSYWCTSGRVGTSNL